MDNHSYVDETLKNIFSDSTIVNVICSVYDRELTSIAIANLLSLDNDRISIYLEKLLDLKLIKKLKKENQEYFALINPKICDSILMLKDAIRGLR
jgi:soluble P-type ATPase